MYNALEILYRPIGSALLIAVPRIIRLSRIPWKSPRNRRKLKYRTLRQKGTRPRYDASQGIGATQLHEKPLISIIIPVHRGDSKLERIRKMIGNSCTTPFELIIVLNSRVLVGTITPENGHEKVVLAEQKGRGYAFVRGVREAGGEIVVMLHSDSILPPRWDKAITEALGNDEVVGGGFSLAYDLDSTYLKALIRISDMLTKQTGEIWGDRAIFIRAKLLRQYLPRIDVPFFEDVIISRCMRENGEVVILKEKVTTSADSFQRNGMFDHLLRIVGCRIWFALGGDPRHIYESYYAKKRNGSSNLV
jgi:uncharacterized protein